MKTKDRILIAVLILLAVAASCLGCTILYQDHYGKLCGQIVALTLCLIMLFATVKFRKEVVKPRCIVVGAILALLMCVTAIFQAPYPWIKTELFVGGASMRPGYFLFPAFSLIGYFLCVKRAHPAWLMVIAFLFSVVAVLMVQPEVVRVLLFMGCFMAFGRCAISDDRRSAATFGCLLGLAALFYASYPLIAQPHDVFWQMDLGIARDRLALLISAPWVGETCSDEWRLVYCCDETVLYALCHQGRLMVIAIAAMAVMMTAVIMHFVGRVHDPARRTLVFGCGASLIAPMWLSFAQFAPCHIGHYSFPWITPSVSLWVSSFFSLGLMIAGFLDERETD